MMLVESIHGAIIGPLDCCPPAVTVLIRTETCPVDTFLERMERRMSPSRRLACLVAFCCLVFFSIAVVDLLFGLSRFIGFQGCLSLKGTWVWGP